MAQCCSPGPLLRFYLANKRELVDDLVVKAKQIEVLIQSLPVPEPEETQVRRGSSFPPFPLVLTRYHVFTFSFPCRHTALKRWKPP